MEPYTGRTEPTRRYWPMYVAVGSLVFLAIIVPIGALFAAFVGNMSLGVPTYRPEREAQAFIAVVVGLVSGGLAVIGGLVAIFAGRGVAVRVVAVFAIALGLFSGGINGLFVASYVRSHTPPAAQPSEPVCGPGSHPAVFGGDSRYTACPGDVKIGEEFAAQALQQLPQSDVTAAAIDEYAAQLGDLENYGGVTDLDDDLVAFWVKAPVTCTIVTWDGSAWSSEVLGMLADGGCVYGGEK